MNPASCFSCCNTSIGPIYRNAHEKHCRRDHRLLDRPLTRGNRCGQAASPLVRTPVGGHGGRAETGEEYGTGPSTPPTPASASSGTGAKSSVAQSRPTASTWSSGPATAIGPLRFEAAPQDAPGWASGTPLRDAVAEAGETPSSADRVLRRARLGQLSRCPSAIPGPHGRWHARRPLLLQFRLPGGHEAVAGRATRLRDRRIPHRHARRGLRPSVHLLVRCLPRAIRAESAIHAQGSNLGPGLGRHARVPLSVQHRFEQAPDGAH